MRAARILITATIVCMLPVWAGDSVEEAQPDIEPLTYEEVVHVEGVSSEELYSRALFWFAESFVSANDVLQVQDRDAGHLLGKGIIPYEPAGLMGSTLIRGKIRFTVKLFAKEGRYKYSFSDFIHEGNLTHPNGGISFGLITTASKCRKVRGTAPGSRQKNWDKMKYDIESAVQPLITALKESMATEVAGEDDW